VAVEAQMKILPVQQTLVVLVQRVKVMQVVQAIPEAHT
jgi:hypothetical protein